MTAVQVLATSSKMLQLTDLTIMSYKAYSSENTLCDV